MTEGMENVKTVTLTVARLEGCMDADIQFEGSIPELQRSVEATLAYYAQELHKKCKLDEEVIDNALASAGFVAGLIARRRYGK